MTQTLSPQQSQLLERAQAAQPIVHKDNSVTPPSILVSGHEYRTALALERKGLARVRYQGQSMGWLSATEKGV